MWGIVFAVMLVGSGAEAQAPAPDLVLRPACGGSGFSGELRREGVAVLFECCKVGDVLRSKLLFADGSPLAAIEWSESEDRKRIEMGGYETSEIATLSSSERRALELLLRSPETDLVHELPSMLEGMGFEVRIASDGPAVLDAHEACDFDAIFMDCRMPGMDGLEATAVIRRRERSRGRHTPIIALTAAVMEGDAA